MKFPPVSIFPPLLVVLPVMLFIAGMSCGVSYVNIGLNEPLLYYYKFVYYIAYSPKTSCAIILCLSICALILIVYSACRSGLGMAACIKPHFYLIGCIILSIISYISLKHNTSGFFELLSFLSGIVIGEILRISLNKKHGAPGIFIYATIVFFSLFSITFPSIQGEIVSYSKHVRWSGVWRNPNTFRLHMSVSILIITNFLLSISSHAKNLKFWIPGLYLCGILFYGLLHSFSRSAAFLLVIGLMLTAILNYNNLMKIIKTGAVCAFLAILLASLTFFKQFQFSKMAVQRYSTATNLSDASIRHRLYGWRDCARMMKASPFLGWGWGHSEKVFSEKYNFECLENTASIKTNSYLILGISSGIPCLLSFLAYLFFSLLRPFTLWLGALRRHRSAVCAARQNTSVVVMKKRALPVSLVIVPALMAAIMPLFNPGLFNMHAWPLLAVLIVLSHDFRPWHI